METEKEKQESVALKAGECGFMKRVGNSVT